MLKRHPIVCFSISLTINDFVDQMMLCFFSAMDLDHSSVTFHFVVLLDRKHYKAMELIPESFCVCAQPMNEWWCCNTIPHWLGTYTEWSLLISPHFVPAVNAIPIFFCQFSTLNSFIFACRHFCIAVSADQWADKALRGLGIKMPMTSSH